MGGGLYGASQKSLNLEIATFQPMVSVLMATRDRPHFFELALRYYQSQTYQRKELIVLDDGSAEPADELAVRAAGGRLIQFDAGTPLGTKLNAGVAEACGTWCQKMDDDDYYGPDFLSEMVGAVSHQRQRVCQRVLAFISPFLFFDLSRWDVRRSMGTNLPGATLFFSRDDARESPFRPLPRDEDVWFFKDQVAAGTALLPVHALESYMAIRHRGVTSNRGHTWEHQRDGDSIEHYLEQRPVYRSPEELIAEPAIASYRQLRREITSDAASSK